MLERRLFLPGEGRVVLEGGSERVVMKGFENEVSRVRARCGDAASLVEADIVNWATPDGKAVSVLLDGFAYSFLLPDPLQSTGEQGADSDAVHAPMTGTVTGIRVSAGDSVSKGDRLVVMEAMKMETSLSAPRDGVVAEICCTEGQSVEGGAVLARLEAIE